MEGALNKTRDGAAPLQVSEVKVRLVDRQQGSLLGWASCVLNGSLFLNGIEIRRSAEGRIFLAFPHQTSPGNRRHFFFNPVNREASRVFEAAILDRLPAGTGLHGNGSLGQVACSNSPREGASLGRLDSSKEGVDNVVHLA